MVDQAEIHRKVESDYVWERKEAAEQLRYNFVDLPDKTQSWKDLHRLTGDDDSDVLWRSADALGTAFQHLPFYRSFCKITFERAGVEGEVHRYFAEVKRASEGSKNKEILLEAIENLANALSEAHKVRDFDNTKSDLKTYMQYCNRAADLIGDASEDTPGAALVLRRGLPIIDDRIKEIIRDIQEKARAVCRETQETPLEELGFTTARSAQELPTQDSLALMMALGNMAEDTIRNWCEYLPTDKKVDACEGPFQKAQPPRPSTSSQ